MEKGGSVAVRRQLGGSKAAVRRQLAVYQLSLFSLSSLL